LPFAKLIGGRSPSFSGFFEKIFGLKSRVKRADELGKASVGEAWKQRGMIGKPSCGGSGLKGFVKD
jgi:hypothetical protein